MEHDDVRAAVERVESRLVQGYQDEGVLTDLQIAHAWKKQRELRGEVGTVDVMIEEGFVHVVVEEGAGMDRKVTEYVVQGGELEPLWGSFGI